MSDEAKKTVKKRTVSAKTLSGRRAPKTEKTAADHKAAPQALKMLVTVVNRNKAEYYTDLIQSFGVNMQFCCNANGTATSEILSLMGLEESGKSVIFSVIREDMTKKAMTTLEEKFATIKNGKGIAMTVPLSSVIGASIYQFLCDNRRGGV